MERVYLLVEDTNRRLPCLLNPETLVQRRLAGVQARRSATGRLTGTGLADDPLLYTGGGYTELELDLLFDVALVDAPQKLENVRALTQPLWELADTAPNGQNRGQPLMVRFLWGKEWNFLGVVVAVAERLDMFTSEGVPQRSWLRLRLVRSQLPVAAPAAARPSLSAAELASLAERVSRAPGGLIELGRPEPGAPVSGQPAGSPEPQGAEAPEGMPVDAEGGPFVLEGAEGPEEGQAAALPVDAEGGPFVLEGAEAPEAVPEETEAPTEEAAGGPLGLEGPEAPEEVPEETEALPEEAAEVPEKATEATGIPEIEPATLLAAVAAEAAAEASPEAAAGSAPGPAGPEEPEAPVESEGSGAPLEQPERRWRLAQRERLDQVAFRYYGDPAYWRLLAIVNEIDDPLHIPDGTVLRVPPVALVSEGP